MYFLLTFKEIMVTAVLKKGKLLILFINISSVLQSKTVSAAPPPPYHYCNYQMLSPLYLIWILSQNKQYHKKLLNITSMSTHP